MKLLSKLGVLIVLACATAPFGCSSDNTPASSHPADSGAEAASNTQTPIKCGGAECPVRDGTTFEGLTPCCTDTNACGFKASYMTTCLPADQPGLVSRTCGDFPVPNTNRTLTGCCTPNGCGKNEPILGCILNTNISGLTAQTCNYDPNNACAGVADIPCDGPEDCPTGKHCCASLSGTVSPDKTGCYDSCVALEADTGGNSFWRELCHAGDTCENTQFQCRASMALPAWLTRCNNSTMGNLAPTNLDSSAGHVNCGSGVCGAGQKCCYVPPAATGIAYCADKNAECKCHAPDGGSGTPEPRGDGGKSPSPSDAGKTD